MSSSAGASWLAIVGWDELTHADATRARGPLPWVRSYTRLLRDDAYMDLTEHRALIFHRLLLEYASSSARLRLETRSLSRRLGVRVTTADLESLNHAGFVRFCASTAQVERWHAASVRDAREEGERERPTRDVPAASYVRERPKDDDQEQGADVADLAVAALDRVFPPEPVELPAEEEAADTVERMRARIGRGMG